MELPNGVVVLTVKIKVVITRYDLVAVTCYALSRKWQFGRNKLILLTKRVIENRGLVGVLACMKKHNTFLPEAEKIVRQFFPELEAKPRKPHQVIASTN